MGREEGGRGEARRTLVLSISTLNLLVDVFLHFALQDSGARGLVESGGFEDMCRIDPVVVSPSHYMLFEICSELEFPYRNLPEKRVSSRP